MSKAGVSSLEDVILFHLIFSGPDAQQRGCWTAPIDYRTRLGRDAKQGWSVPWDMRISREHADLQFCSDRLEVRCLDSARNAAVLNGSSARSFAVRPGEEFQIGHTVFRLEKAGSEESPPKSLLKKIRKAPRGSAHDSNDAEQRLEAILDFLEEDNAADYEPESYDDHIRLTPTNAEADPTRGPQVSDAAWASQIATLEQRLGAAIAEQERLVTLRQQADQRLNQLRRLLAEKDDQITALEDKAYQDLQSQQGAFEQRLANALKSHQTERDLLAEQLNSTEGKAEELAAQLERLNDDRGELTGQVKQLLEEKLKADECNERLSLALTEQRHAAEHAAEANRQDLEQLTDSNANLLSSLLESRASKTHLESHLNELQERLATSQAQLASASAAREKETHLQRQQIEQLDAELQNQSAQNEKLAAANEKLQAANADGLQSVSDLETRLHAADEAKRTLTDSLASARDELAVRKRELESLRAALETQQATILEQDSISREIFEATLADEQRRGDALQARVTALAAENSGLAERWSKLQDEHTARGLELGRSQQEYDEARAENARLADQLGSSNEKLRELQGMRDELDAKWTDSQAEIARQRELLAALEAHKQRAEKEAESARIHSDSVGQRAADMEDQLTRLQSALARETTALNDWQSRCRSVEAESKAELKDYAQRLEKASQEASAVRNEAEKLDSRLTRESQRRELAEQQCEETLQELARIQSEAAETRRELRELLAQSESRLAESESTIQQLTDQVRQFQLVSQEETSANSDLQPEVQAEQLQLLADRRRKLILWLRNQLEKTKTRLQREAASRRKADAHVRRLINEIERLRESGSGDSTHEGDGS